ncbi:MAG TPA: hypothetical protein VLG67_02650 [Candidatus Saccharimonadales bacterium]|nr:hypothetical protein [Candidatus Saccharimonadales bacterium]
MLKQFFKKPQFAVIAGIALVFGLFASVLISQQNQENRSRADTSGTGNCSTVNASSGETLTSDNCTIQSGFNGSIVGNNNTIMGGLGGAAPNITGSGNLIMGGSNGSIYGSGNEVCGGLNGGITGNNNIIHGSVGGPINGTGNQINFSGVCGTIRQPSPTVTTAPPATCADGIDNNQNELIDAGDPACHTDGNQNNPGSYDPSRNEGPAGPTVTQGPTITVTPTTGPTLTIPPTLTPTTGPTILPTITIPPGNTSMNLKLLLHGIGQGGDSANPQSGGNPNPIHTQRSVTVQIFNSQNDLVATKTGAVNFNSLGQFSGVVDLGNTITTGVYTVKVKTTQFLKTLAPGIQNITAGTANNLPATTLVNGDINSDNSLNILDYNILMGCYSDFLPAVSCTSENNLLSDLDDDGAVNQFDYNLFLRELTNRQGQ